MPLSPLLAGYDNVLLDLDGCMWVGENPTPNAADAVAELRAAGKKIVFLTNDSRRSPEEYVRKLWSHGVQASLEEVVTVGSTIQWMLAGRERASVFVIGSEAVFRHVDEAGHRIVNGTPASAEAQVVVVAGHDDFDFAELRTATRALLAGAELLAADRDRTFPAEDGLTPGSGAIVAALEYAADRTAVVAGKPNPQIFRSAIDRLGDGRTLMIGDHLDSDLGGASGVGIDAAIVLTGVTRRDQAESATDPAPVAIAENLHSLVTSR
jgi:glycerol 3-phosphatase-2